MNIEQKDIKLNFNAILTTEGAPDLSQKQIYSIALASAYATKQPMLIDTVHSQAREYLTDNDIQAAKSAAAIMAMNNIYYRFVHLSSDKSYGAMPARLRMNVIANPGVEKVDFELACLAVSALNGCGMCMDAHAHELTSAGMTKVAIQSAVRIAAVVNAVAVSLG